MCISYLVGAHCFRQSGLMSEVGREEKRRKSAGKTQEKRRKNDSSVGWWGAQRSEQRNDFRNENSYFWNWRDG